MNKKANKRVNKTDRGTTANKKGITSIEILLVSSAMLLKAKFQKDSAMSKRALEIFCSLVDGCADIFVGLDSLAKIHKGLMQSENSKTSEGGEEIENDGLNKADLVEYCLSDEVKSSLEIIATKMNALKEDIL